MTSSPQRTPLYDAHKALGGRLVSFAGWELPVRYSDVAEEHRTVREAVGLFDVSHMGEIEVAGPEAEAALEYLTCNAVSTLTDGRAQYSALTNQKGGVVDDIIIYRYSSDHYLLCVNASNTDKDFDWLVSNNRFDATFTNVSSDYGQIAIQGPKAEATLMALAPETEADQAKYFSFKKTTLEKVAGGVEVILARTGYTGEDGFELFVPAAKTEAVWQALLEAGSSFGILPCGLGARDSLRLEACYPLHGHELGDNITAIESGLGWIVKPAKKGDFIGRDILVEQKANGAPRKLVGFFVTDKGVVREGAEVQDEAGNVIGIVTSGTKTPTVGRSLGLALLKSDAAATGTTIKAVVRNRELACEIVATPFYKRGK